MRNNQDNASEVLLSLELDASFERVLDPGDPFYKVVHHALVRGLAVIMETLGIPGTTVVQITPPKQVPMHANRFLRLYVNGQLCCYSDELLQYVYSYVNSSNLNPQAKPGNILVWLKRLSNDQSETTELSHKKLAKFFSLTCVEIIKRQPAVLLGLDQVVAYITSLPIENKESTRQPEVRPPEPTWLHPILSEVLDLKISLADKKKVAQVLRQSQEKSREDITEDLIVALQADVVEIQLPQEYLKQITTFEQENARSLFTFLRTDVFQELGLLYPSFRFVQVENLKSNSFAFKINHLTTVPLIGLLPNQYLVNDTASRLRLMNIQGTATSNPASGVEGCLIDASSLELAVSAGLTKWNQIEYLILSFAAILRENAECFIDRQTVQDQLEQIKSVSPALATAVEAKVSMTQITRVLRALLAEEISVRNLKIILERLLEYNYSAATSSAHDPADEIATTSRRFDDTPLNSSLDLISFVRTGMKGQIKQKYSRGTSTVVVYLLDQEIEELLSKHQSLESGEMWRTRLHENERDKIIEAIRAEIAHLPSTALLPTILTTVDVRSSIYEMIAPELPRMSVISYEDLPCDTNIQPVARISLNT